MSYSYHLELEAGADPADLMRRIAAICGVPATGAAIVVEGIRISAAPVAEDDAELTLRSYRFAPASMVTFRHSAVASGEAATRSMLGIVRALFAALPGRAVLESQDPVTVLFRNDERIVINRSWSQAEDVAGMFPGSEIRELPAL